MIITEEFIMSCVIGGAIGIVMALALRGFIAMIGGGKNGQQ